MENIETTVLRSKTFLQGYNSKLDLSKGSVLSEWLLKPDAALHNELINNEIQALDDVHYIDDALASTTNTYATVIDKIASNFGVTRIAGSKATGTLTIVVTNRQPYTIEKGTRFVYPNLSLGFITTATNRISINDISTYGTQFSFQLAVEAEAIGTATIAIAEDTVFALDTNFSINGFVQAFATDSFTAGVPMETDVELINRFKDGRVVKNFSSAAAIKSKLQDIYPSLNSVAVMGAGDKEILRGKNTAFGISAQGAADIFVRNGYALTTVTLDTSNGAIACPGLYRLKPQANIQAHYGLTSDASSALLTNAMHGRFSSYQTLTVTGTSSVVGYRMLYVEDMQALLSSDENRQVGANYMVKGIVPCLVTVSLTIKSNPANPVTDTVLQSIQADISNYINLLTFGDKVQASRIVDLCHNYVQVSAVELPLSLRGDIWLPVTDLVYDASGRTDVADTYVLNANNALSIPDNATLTSYGISARNTLYFVQIGDAATINISVK